MLAAGETLRGLNPTLSRLSARHLRSICRPWFRAGATPGQILVAVNSAPSGEPHLYAGRVRNPAAWLRARLALWLDDDGMPGTVTARTAHARGRPGSRPPAGTFADAIAAAAAAAARAAALWPPAAACSVTAGREARFAAYRARLAESMP